MSAAEAISDAEADRIFSDLAHAPALLLAVSGGPDSTALLWLAARWRKRRKRGPKLLAVTIDHGLRQEARREALAVRQLAKRLGIAHRTLRWGGAKPTTGLQEAARAARYGLLARAARSAGAPCLLTAHTLDDQAETILFRLARGSGIAGLAGMTRVTAIGPASSGDRDALWLARPFLDIPKARLIATLRAAAVPFADDPSNRDPRFARARLREILPQLASEGLHAARLAIFARRMRRADAAIEAVVDAALRRLAGTPDRLAVAADFFRSLPAEVALRLIGRAAATVGDEGPVELGKLEALLAALAAAVAADMRFRRTLAGAMVTFARGEIAVERAPARQNRPKRPHKSHRRAGKPPFTTGG